MENMAQGASNLSGVQVEIFGHPYSLGGGDPDHVRKLAEYVDSRMRTIAETHMADSTELAVLAALNIAHEYHLLKTRLDGEEGETSGEEKTAEHRFTQEDKQRVRERRQSHHTRRWYEKQLLAIANGELSPTKEQHKALLAFGKGRGWNRYPPGQR